MYVSMPREGRESLGGCGKIHDAYSLTARIRHRLSAKGIQVARSGLKGTEGTPLRVCVVCTVQWINSAPYLSDQLTICPEASVFAADVESFTLLIVTGLPFSGLKGDEEWT